MTISSDFKGRKRHQITRKGSATRPLQEQDENMQDETSITPIIGMRTNSDSSVPMPLYHEACAVSETFVIPGPPPPVRNDEIEDNISVLTDCSWMDEEEDASSQVAASVASESWTVVTSATDSITIPTRNTLTHPVEKKTKRRHVVSVAYDNGPFKRRRKL